MTESESEFIQAVIEKLQAEPEEDQAAFWDIILEAMDPLARYKLKEAISAWRAREAQWSPMEIDSMVRMRHEPLTINRMPLPVGLKAWVGVEPGEQVEQVEDPDPPITTPLGRMG